MIPTLLTATFVFIIAFIAAPPVDIDGIRELQNFGPDIPSHGRRAYQQKSRIEVKDKDLKPKRIKDFLECKISQRTQESKVNPVHVRNQKHELTPPRSRCQESDSSTVEGTVYKQAEQLFGLRHKPITPQDALPRSESAEKICPGRTRCLLLRHPLCHPVQADYRSP
ncbi:hypothetical protein GQ457_02G025720 [Hibiscus cannabinus]